MKQLSYEEAKAELTTILQQGTDATRNFSLGYIAALRKHTIVSTTTYIKLTKFVLGDILK